jgi:hypothetical protein
MGHGVFVPFRADRDLAHGEALPELHQLRFGDEVALGGPAQEIDVEIGGAE